MNFTTTKLIVDFISMCCTINKLSLDYSLEKNKICQKRLTQTMILHCMMIWVSTEAAEKLQIFFPFPIFKDNKHIANIKQIIIIIIILKLSSYHMAIQMWPIN